MTHLLARRELFSVFEKQREIFNVIDYRIFENDGVVAESEAQGSFVKLCKSPNDNIAMINGASDPFVFVFVLLLLFFLSQ